MMDVVGRRYRLDCHRADVEVASFLGVHSLRREAETTDGSP
jgi:hypothetical protein